MTRFDDALIDALREIINIGVGRAAGTLNELLGQHIALEVPQIRIINQQELDGVAPGTNDKTVSMVLLQFSGEFSGFSTLLFTADCASKLVDLLVDDETPNSELDAIKTGTLTEVGNILLNAVMGSIANLLKSHLNYTIPRYQEGSLRVLLDSIWAKDSESALEITTRFTVQTSQITGEFLVLFEVGSFNTFIAGLQAAFDE